MSSTEQRLVTLQEQVARLVELINVHVATSGQRHEVQNARIEALEKQVESLQRRAHRHDRFGDIELA